MKYSEERKAALLNQLLPPLNRSVAEVARQEGVSQSWLYHWRNQTQNGGASVAQKVNHRSDRWSAEAKFAAVLATASLSELELGEYCRSQGLYVEQIQGWRAACIQGQQSVVVQQQTNQVQAKADQKRIRQLEQELRRKDTALAEAAALLMLQKKLDAYWSNVDEAD